MRVGWDRRKPRVGGTGGQGDGRLKRGPADRTLGVTRPWALGGLGGWDGKGYNLNIDERTVLGLGPRGLRVDAWKTT